MPNMLVIYEQESVSQKLLCVFLSRYCDETGYSISIKRSRHISVKDIESADLLVTIRSMAPLETRIVKTAKKANIPCICYWDDDLTQDTDSLFVPTLRRKAMIEELKHADAILTSNGYLSNKLASYGNNPIEIMIDTVIDETDLRDKEASNKQVKIVYAAGPSHSKDFNIEMETAFALLQEELPGQFSLAFVGVKPELHSNYSFPVEYIPGMSLDDYRKHMISENYDIGLAPIPHSEFSKSKYYNKYIEYTLVNVVGIYSCFPPYTLIIKDGVNGYLSEESTESWYNALYKAITDNRLRNDCLNNAKQMLIDEFSFDAVSSKFSEGIKSIQKEKKKKKINAFPLWLSKLSYPIFKYIYLPVTYISNEGLKGTIKRINNYSNSIKLLKGE